MGFTEKLLIWYEHNKRDLPWRKTRDPYTIWISEIILQQTRIGQGLAYYNRFISRFNNVQALASADEREVLKLWQGLGYYSRARNLHQAAREIMQKYGAFPADYEAIRSLKGIGDYTAAAIASVSFNLPYAVVDGNVLRFFSRYFGVTDPVDNRSGKTAIRDLAQENLDISAPGIYNQAIMEFGALQCKAASPDCSICPFHKDCFAFTHGKIMELPLKSSKTKSRNRYFNYLVLVYTDSSAGTTLYFRKREEDDIWKNLYDFPVVESSRALSVKKLAETPIWQKLVPKTTSSNIERSKIYRHILSHQVIIARFHVIHLNKRPSGSLVPVGKDSLDEIPVPRLIEKFLVSFLRTYVRI